MSRNLLARLVWLPMASVALSSCAAADATPPADGFWQSADGAVSLDFHDDRTVSVAGLPPLTVSEADYESQAVPRAVSGTLPWYPRGRFLVVDTGAGQYVFAPRPRIADYSYDTLQYHPCAESEYVLVFDRVE